MNETEPRAGLLEFIPTGSQAFFSTGGAFSSSWVKVVMVPGDAVPVPKGWWHAVRSTPNSVAISVAVHIGTVDKRSVQRRMCRRDAQPEPPARGVPNVRPGSDQASNSRRADFALGNDDPTVY